MTTLSCPALLERLQPQIHAYALRYRDCAEVEDLEQQARLAIWQNWQRIVLIDNPEAYAVTVAKHAMYHLAMHEVSHAAMSLETVTTRRGKHEAYQVELPESPAQKRLSSLAQRRRIFRALRKLTPHQRHAILAYYRIEDSRNQRAPDFAQDRASYNSMHGARSKALSLLRAYMVV